MSGPQRYRFVVEHNAKNEFLRAYAAPLEGSWEPGNDWVTFSDHERALAAKDAEIAKLREELACVSCGDGLRNQELQTEITKLKNLLK